MKKNKLIKLLTICLLIVISFLFNQGKVKAEDEAAVLSMKNTFQNCSKYFSLRSSSAYENDWALFSDVYDQGRLNAGIWVNGSRKLNDDKEFDSSDTVTTAWFFQTPSMSEYFKSDAKLTIDVYSGSTKICSADITGFSTTKYKVKVALSHDKIIQSVILKGTFKNGSYTDTDEINLKVVESTTTTALNTEKGTKQGKVKQEVISTNENGDLIISNGTSCTDVSELVHDYWKYVVVSVPILLILVMMIDFFKAIVSNDADAIKKASTSAVKRTIAAVILLALPVLLGFIFNLFGLELCV